MRTINYWGGPTSNGGAMGSEDGQEIRAWNVYGIDEGGMTIHYHHEDLFVRRYYAERLGDVGGQIQMPESPFAGPSEVGTGAHVSNGAGASGRPVTQSEAAEVQSASAAMTNSVARTW